MKNSQRGQAGLIAILIALTLTVIGLSVASRASREALISTSESEGTRTLEGAQTGAEAGLQTEFGESAPVSVDSDGIFDNTSIGSAIGNETVDLILEEGMSLEINGGLNNGGKISWGESGSNQAGLLISCYRGNEAFYQAYRPRGSSSSEQYNGDFTEATADPVSGFVNAIGADEVINALGDCEFVRIKALYATTVIRVEGITPNNIRTVRGAGVNQQDAQGRLVEVRETAPGRPLVLDYALFAGNGSIAK